MVIHSSWVGDSRSLDSDVLAIEFKLSGAEVLLLYEKLSWQPKNYFISSTWDAPHTKKEKPTDCILSVWKQKSRRAFMARVIYPDY